MKEITIKIWDTHYEEEVYKSYGTDIKDTQYMDEKDYKLIKELNEFLEDFRKKEAE